ncbi:hypothetical protein CK203_050833 [Vitis vinifera]|uniref:Uncharacterized protein n=1 Tax=Vitis vinifera TaxID=29760 RepID=A0A438HBL7_VITVI|nr:hypothetical protein CK203_050833 [Vitis vinifera]
MAKTRGTKSSSPSSRLRSPRETPVQGSIPEPPQPLVVPPPVEDASLSPHSRCYETRRPPTTPAAKPSLEPQPSQPPAIKSQIPLGMTPEVLIRCPMVTQPPIEARPQGLLPSVVEVQDPTVIHFTIDGCHGILGARHIVNALHIPYEPVRLEDYRVWTHLSQSDIVHIMSRGASAHYIGVQRRGVLLKALFRISKGLFFGPHHLIIAALLYFEEKVHRKKLLRVMLFHFSSPDCYIFTLDKWTSMTAYSADPGAPTGPEHPDIPYPEQPEEPQPVEIPVDKRASATLRTPLLFVIIKSRLSPLRLSILPSLGRFNIIWGILLAPDCTIPILLEPTEPSQAPPYVEQTMPSEEPTIGDAETSTPSISVLYS